MPQSYSFYASKPCCFAPGLSGYADFLDWRDGKKSIALTDEAPGIEFTSPLFRRRLSQLCKMTVQVVHDCVEETDCRNSKIVFVSMRGEINREFSVNKKLIEENEVSPAAFQYSVFNAPVALATIACQLKGGYTTVFPSKGNFLSALQCALASLMCGREERILFVYGDELVPQVYGDLRPQGALPLAYATVLSCKKDAVCERQLSVSEQLSPADFLKMLL